MRIRSRAPTTSTTRYSLFPEHTDPLWRYTTTSSNDIQDLTQSGVGVGLASGTTPAATLDITSTGSCNASVDFSRGNGFLIVYGGTAAGNAGQINTTKICDTSGANCFVPSTIASGSLKCPAGQIMSGISNNAAICLTKANILCPAATPVLNGFNSNGTPNCVAAPNAGCTANPAYAVPAPACGGATISLPALNDTQTTSVFTVNAATNGCRQIQMKCNAGTWAVNSDTNSSLCSFTSTSQPVACNCASVAGESASPARARACNGVCARPDKGAPVYTTTGCTCPGGEVDTTGTCSFPFTGTYTIKTIYQAGTCSVLSQTNTSATDCTCAAPDATTADGATRTVYSACSSNGYNSRKPRLQ